LALHSFTPICKSPLCNLKPWSTTPEDHTNEKFTAVKEMDLDLFAEYFTKSIPINALVYDNRCFGTSDGMPRFEIIPSLQMSDIQDAITFAQSLPEVDPEKIAIWGSSYSGAHVLQVAAFDRRVKAVLAQAPMVSGVETTHRVVGSIKAPIFDPIFHAGTSFEIITDSRPCCQNERGRSRDSSGRH
jgi:hypothetical protein